jgi:hypothetical protein
MAPQVGTYTIADLLDVRFQSVNEFGTNTVVEVLQNDLTAHNAIVDEMLGDLAAETTDTQDVYGTGSSGEMVEVDEFGRSETQKAAPGSTVAYPLRLFQYGIGWTRKWMQSATPADLALRQLDAQKAHLKRIRYDIKRALFLSTNYTFNDFLINNVALGVKRLVNADSAAIPDAPDGATFNAATHTHYDANATLTTAVVDAAITDLIEHGHGSRPRIAIHYSNAAAFTALTGFVLAVPQYVQTPAYNVTIPSVRTDLGNQYNRLLGYYGAAEVWVKPWAVANYFFLWDAGAAGKPLKRRQRAGGPTGLQIAAPFEGYPLYAEYMEAEFGFGVWTRTNGVAVQFNNGTYQNPTLTQ